MKSVEQVSWYRLAPVLGIAISVGLFTLSRGLSDLNGRRLRDDRIASPLRYHAELRTLLAGDSLRGPALLLDSAALGTHCQRVPSLPAIIYLVRLEASGRAACAQSLTVSARDSLRESMIDATRAAVVDDSGRVVYSTARAIAPERLQAIVAVTSAVH